MICTERWNSKLFFLFHPRFNYALSNMISDTQFTSPCTTPKVYLVKLILEIFFCLLNVLSKKSSVLSHEFTLVFAASMGNFAKKRDKLNVAWSVAKAPKAQKNFCCCKKSKIIMDIFYWGNHHHSSQKKTMRKSLTCKSNIIHKQEWKFQSNRARI